MEDYIDFLTKKNRELILLVEKMSANNINDAKHVRIQYIMTVDSFLEMMELMKKHLVKARERCEEHLRMLSS